MSDLHAMPSNTQNANPHADHSFNQPEIECGPLLPSSPKQNCEDLYGCKEPKSPIWPMKLASVNTVKCPDLASSGPESRGSHDNDPCTVSDKNVCGAEVPKGSSHVMDQDAVVTQDSAHCPSPSSCSASPVSVTMMDVSKETSALTAVSRACSNCKKSHLGCDFARPCKRCINSGKQDTCQDVPKKVRSHTIKAKADIVKEMLKHKTQLDEFAGRITVARACNHCRKSHLRCDYSRPCQRCIVSGKADSCQDVENKRRKRQGEGQENVIGAYQRLSETSDTDDYRPLTLSAPTSPCHSNHVVGMPPVSPFEYHPYSFYSSRTASPVVTHYQQAYSPFHDMRPLHPMRPEPLLLPVDPFHPRIQNPSHPLPRIGYKRGYSPDSPMSAPLQETAVYPDVKRYTHISPVSSPLMQSTILTTLSNVACMDFPAIKRLPPSPYEPVHQHKKRNSGFNMEDLLKK